MGIAWIKDPRGAVGLSGVLFGDRQRYYRTAERSLGIDRTPPQPEAVVTVFTGPIIVTVAVMILWASFLTAVLRGWAAAVWAFDQLQTIAGG